MNEIIRSKANKAHSLVCAAVNRGKLIRPDICEMCERDYYKKIGGHHHNGYDDIYNVWWVCSSCNIKLPHNGKLTKEQARDIVQTGWLTKEARDTNKEYSQKRIDLLEANPRLFSRFDHYIDDIVNWLEEQCPTPDILKDEKETIRDLFHPNHI